MKLCTILLLKQRNSQLVPSSQSLRSNKHRNKTSGVRTLSMESLTIFAIFAFAIFAFLKMVIFSSSSRTNAAYNFAKHFYTSIREKNMRHWGFGPLRSPLASPRNSYPLPSLSPLLSPKPLPFS